MANRRVALLLRGRTTDNKRTSYLNPVVGNSRKIKPGWGVLRGTPTNFGSSCSYYLRFKTGRKLVYEYAGVDLAQAQAKLAKKRNLLRAVSEGVAILPVKESERVRLADAVAKYLDEVEQSKSESTHDSYRCSLAGFAASCSKTFTDELHRDDVLQ